MTLKIILTLLFVFAGAAVGLYWQQTDESDLTPVSATSPDPVAKVVTDEQGDAVNSESIVAEPDSGSPFATRSAGESGENAESSDNESPFGVVQQNPDTNGSGQAPAAMGQGANPVADNSPTAEPTAEPTTEPTQPIDNRGGRPVVVVPESYPVTDAAKYFVPRDERGPGNLGGPPPLDFPGGPSDPNRLSPPDDFQPPPAPGQ